MPSSHQKCCHGIQQRLVITILVFLGMFCTYTLRGCLAMAILKMTVPRNQTEELVGDDSCPTYELKPHTSTVVKHSIEVESNLFEWSEYTQGIILSSFYWGYGIGQVPGGILIQKFGIRIVFGLSIFFQSLLTLITPAMTYWGEVPALVTLRFLLGAFQGCVQPAVSETIAQWLPPDERTKLGSLIYAGTPLGNLVSTSLSGKLMSINHIGWQGIFYIYGVMTLVWVILWIFLGFSSAEEHPFISQKEKDYLIQKLREHKSEKRPPTPWKHLFTSKPFLALVAIQMGQDWTMYTVMSDLPKYMSNVLKLPVDITGYASSFHNAIGMFYAIAISWFADFLIAKGRLSRVATRKLHTTIASVGTGLFLISGVYAGCNTILAIVLINIGMILKHHTMPGIKVNNVDLSPNYAALMMGVINGLSSIAGIFAPYVVGVLAPNQTLQEWKLIFWIMFVALLVTNAIFVMFGSADVQRWNDLNYQEGISMDKANDKLLRSKRLGEKAEESSGEIY